jgi:hypothetical protein
MPLYPYAQYAIRSISHLVDHLTGQLPYLEDSRWTRAREHLDLATTDGLEFPIIFGDASDGRRLLGWAILDEVDLEAKHYRVRAFRPFIKNHDRTELKQVKGGYLQRSDRYGNRLVVKPKWLERDSRSGIENLELDPSEQLEGELKVAMRLHRHREKALREAKLKIHKHANGGRLPCEVPGCGFDFVERYGEDRGGGFAEVHHIDPLSTRGRPTLTSLSQLMVICPNCHAMIHRRGDLADPATLITNRRA